MVNTLAESRIEKSEKMPNLRVRRHSKDYKSARILHKKSSKGTFSFTRIRVQYKVYIRSSTKEFEFTSFKFFTQIEKMFFIKKEVLPHFLKFMVLTFIPYCFYH